MPLSLPFIANKTARICRFDVRPLIFSFKRRFYSKTVLRRLLYFADCAKLRTGVVYCVYFFRILERRRTDVRHRVPAQIAIWVGKEQPTINRSF